MVTSSAGPGRKGKPSICLVFSSPETQSGESVSIRIADFIRIVEPSVDKVFVIAGGIGPESLPGSSNVRFAGTVSCPDSGAPVSSVVAGELRAQVEALHNLSPIFDRV